MNNYAESDEYKNFLSEFNYVFSEKYNMKNDLIKLSDKLTANIDYFIHDDKHNRSIIRAQIVELKNYYNEIVFSTRTIGDVFYQFIEHSSGNKYFIVGSSIDNYVLYNISQNITKKYVGEHFIKDSNNYPKQELYWYIVNLFYNPVNNLIILNGQDVLNCSRVSVCDFNDDNLFPLFFYSLSSLIFGYDEGENHIAKNWTEENCLKVEVIEESCNTFYLTEKEIKTEIEKLN